MKHDARTIQRFWSKVDRTGGEHACWLWTAGLFDTGYGAFNLDHQNIGAHRFAWEVDHDRRLPDGFMVLHSCDIRACVNPKHLVVGTQLDNMRDKCRKGRQARGARQGSAVLTEAKVSAICSLLNAGVSQREIARRHRVSQTTIGGINRGIIWGWFTRRGRVAA